MAKKKTVKKLIVPKTPVIMIFFEIILSALLVYEFVQLVGLRFGLHGLTFSFSTNPMDYIFFVMTIFLLTAIYFTLKKEHPTAFKAQQLVGTVIKDATKEKLFAAKEDPRIAALILIEFVLVIVIAFAIAAYLDPEWEIIKWQEFNIFEPISTVLNVIIFIIVLALFLFLYNYTKEFRIKS